MKRMVVIIVVLPGMLWGQLAQPGTAGIAMGHVHLNVTDITAQREFWVRQFDAKPVEHEGVSGVMVPGMLILFTQRAPTHSSEGTMLDHFGFKVRSREEMLERARAAGLTMGRVFTGVEGFPNAYVFGPDGVKVEMQEDTSLKVRAVAQHFHYLVPEPGELQKWYVEKFGMAATKRGPYESADVPGMNLTFAPARAPVVKASRGGMIDHFGLEVKGLEAWCRRLEAGGVKLDVAYHREAGFASAMVTDPQGVSIELTEGLRAW